MEGTNYDKLALKYRNFKSITDWELGYKNVIKLLGNIENKVILDYGCGEGRVARFVRDMGAKVIGIDPSKEMIQTASKNYSENIEYHIAGNVNFLNSNSVDAAMLNFVLCCIPTKEGIVEILKNIGRVLKKGSPLIILSNHPKAVGKEFVSFKILKEDDLFSGKRIRVVLRSEKPFEVIDYYWSIKDYRDALTEAGFTVSESMEPKIPPNNKDFDWLDEKKYPPYIIIKAVKQ